MKKDVDANKRFIDSAKDTRRQAYARRATTIPRHCVFFITTNNKMCLTDMTGNRRYPIIVCHNKLRHYVEGLTDTYIQQIWAEVFAHYNELSRRFSDLDNETTQYTDISKVWRKHIDDSIDFWKKTFTNYCHDVNRNTAKVFVATHGNFRQTEKIMRPYILKAGIENIHKHVKNVIRSAQLQIKNDLHPKSSSPSWEPPKTSETDF